MFFPQSIIYLCTVPTFTWRTLAHRLFYSSTYKLLSVVLVDSWLMGGYCVIIIWFLALKGVSFDQTLFFKNSVLSTLSPQPTPHIIGLIVESWNQLWSPRVPSTGLSLTVTSLAALWLVLPTSGELLTLRSGCCTFPEVFNWAKTLSWGILVYSISWITWTEAYWWNFTEKIDLYSKLHTWY